MDARIGGVASLYVPASFITLPSHFASPSRKSLPACFGLTPRRLFKDSHQRPSGSWHVNRFGEPDLTTGLDDCFDCSHRDQGPNTAAGIRKVE
jgi:hypothetical protein